MIPIFDLFTPIISKVLDFIPDPKMKAEAVAKAQQALLDNQEHIMSMLSASDQKQAETNTAEAASANMFIAGWRPFIGWTCGAAFAWVYVLQPIATFIATLCHNPIVLPSIDFSTMSTVLMGMLGLAGMRSWEKSQGVHNDH